MRLIDGDALWMDVIHSMDYCDDVLKIIERQPTIEERKKGTWKDEKGNPVEWEKIGDDQYPLGWCYCSVCGEYLVASDEYTVFGYFCPNCGADMRGDSNG